MSRCRSEVLFEGRVQGVGFRYTILQLASGFELSGTVCNLKDGRVELVVEGEKSELTAFQKAIRESELGHFIRNEDIRWLEPQNNVRGFSIIR